MQIDDYIKQLNFCEQNRWHSYDCKLCKVILPSLGSYEKHSQSEIHLLNLDKYKHNFNIYTEKPVVLLTIFEHNANLIPWRESGANVIIIPMTKNGDLDYNYLKQ